MSDNKYYYGEIVAKIAAKLFPCVKSKDQLSVSLNENDNLEDALCGLCADAGRIWDSFEDLSGEHFIDWKTALDEFSNRLSTFIVQGRVPSMADMMSMAVNSMEQTRAQISKH